MQIVLGGSIASYSVPSYYNQEYPALAILLGWSISMCSLVPIPLLLGVVLWRHFAKFVPDPLSPDEEAEAACCPPGVGAFYALLLRARPYLRHLLRAFRPVDEWRERIEERRRSERLESSSESGNCAQDGVGDAAVAAIDARERESQTTRLRPELSAPSDAFRQPLVVVLAGISEKPDSNAPSVPIRRNVSETSAQSVSADDEHKAEHMNGLTSHTADANGDLELVALSSSDR